MNKYRKVNCSICKKEICLIFLESVWEINDEKVFSLIHHICLNCHIENKEFLPKIEGLN